MCYDIWIKVKNTYSNIVNHLYDVAYNIISMKKEGMDMQSYTEKIDSLIVTNFDAFMPFTNIFDKNVEQCGKF